MPDTETVQAPQHDLSDLLLRPDVQQAINDLVLQLPKLAPAVSLLAKSVEIAREAVTDGEFLGGLETLARQKMQPLRSRVQDYTGMIQEAKERAASNREHIGVFGLMRMLKDPNVQYLLHFVQALLEVAGERGVLPRR